MASRTKIPGSKEPSLMNRTPKDNNLKVRALRRARELREVSASSNGVDWSDE